MGLSRAAVEIIIHEHLYRPIEGKILLIGRQDTDVSPEAMISLLSLHGLSPHVPFTVETRDTLEYDSAPLKPADERVTAASVFHALTNCEVTALDVSDHEGAEIVHDINMLVPEKLKAQFDFIFDGNCLEDIFDGPQAIRNMSELLRPGGRMLLCNANNSNRASYLQYSPGWFFDFFAANDYADCKIYVHEIPERTGTKRGSGQFRHFDPLVVVHRQAVPQRATKPTSAITRFVYVVAEKGTDSTSTLTPSLKHHDGAHTPTYVDGAIRFRMSARPIFGPRAGDAFAAPGIGRRHTDAIEASLTFRRYIGAGVGTLLAVAALVALPVFFGYGQTGTLNNFALPLKDDNHWYRDFAGRSVPEINDPDMFYHNIGPSIAEAKKADIILLGPSFMLYGMDPELLRQFGERHHVKIYNMAFLGIRSGEFSRRIARDWDLHPKLWVVNVDDQIQHFFSSDPTWALSSRPPEPIPTLQLNRLQGWIAVARRNLKWRWEDYRAQRRTTGPFADTGIYRRYEDGAAYIGNNPRYNALDNPLIKVTRDQNCHTTDAIIAEGRRYLADIGGRSILTLIPHSAYCLQQAKELGETLGAETLLPPTTDYTTVDGGHLDHKGAVAFTQQFLEALEKSASFKAALGQ